MYAQIFFVTSVRGNFFAPQIAASSGLRTFGAKMPFPAFFMVVVVISIGGRKCKHGALACGLRSR